MGVVTQRNAEVATDFSILEEVLPPNSPPDTFLTGFSHPYFETPQVVMELLFMPRKIVHGHVFKPTNRKGVLDTEIARILSAPGALGPWGGHKMCGGFHADFCLRWTTDAGNWDMIVCTGCDEVILYHNGKVMKCDMSIKAARLTLEAIKLADKTNT